MADPLTPGDVEHEDDRDRRDRRLEVGLERERYAPNLPTGSPDASTQPDAASANESRRHPTHCSMCGKPLEAQLTCPACGDEDTDILPNGELNDGIAA